MKNIQVGCFLGTVILFSLILGYGLLDNLVWQMEKEPNVCGMTHMFPNFFKLHSSLKSRYSLYFYKDGQLAFPQHVMSPSNSNVQLSLEERKANHMKENLKGIPILFIPGNAGSYKQIRSIASDVQKLTTKGLPTFDFFTLDFREELSAFSGHVLLNEVEFVNECIRFILELYSSKEMDWINSVVLIGHSMGGFVSRAIFTDSNFKVGSVSTIITLNSPHAGPPILVDSKLASLYHLTNSFWHNSFSSENIENSILRNVSILSLAGGIRDTLIRSDLCSLSSLVPQTNGLTSFTTGLENVWLTADHQASLWCSQLVRHISSFLFKLTQNLDSNNGNRFRINPDHSIRIQIMKRHFESNMPKYLGFEDSSLEISDALEKEQELEFPTSTNQQLNSDSIPTQQQQQRKPIEISRHLSGQVLNERVGEIFKSPSEIPCFVWPLHSELKQNFSFMLMLDSEQMDFIQNPSRIYIESAVLINSNNNNHSFVDISNSIQGISPTNSLIYLSSDEFKSFEKLSICLSTLDCYETNCAKNRGLMLTWQFWKDSIRSFPKHSEYFEEEAEQDGWFVKVSKLPFQKQFPKNHKNLVNISIPNQSKQYPLRLKIDLESSRKECGVAVVYQYTASLEEQILRKGNDLLLNFHAHPLQSRENLHLLVWVPSSCEFNLSLKIDYLGSITQILRSYAVILFPLIFVVCLMAFRRQLSFLIYRPEAVEYKFDTPVQSPVQSPELVSNNNRNNSLKLSRTSFENNFLNNNNNNQKNGNGRLIDLISNFTSNPYYSLSRPTPLRINSPANFESQSPSFFDSKKFDDRFNFENNGNQQNQQQTQTKEGSVWLSQFETELIPITLRAWIAFFICFFIFHGLEFLMSGFWNSLGFVLSITSFSQMAEKLPSLEVLFCLFFMAISIVAIFSTLVRGIMWLVNLLVPSRLRRRSRILRSMKGLFVMGWGLTLCIVIHPAAAIVWTILSLLFSNTYVQPPHFKHSLLILHSCALAFMSLSFVVRIKSGFYLEDVWGWIWDWSWQEVCAMLAVFHLWLVHIRSVAIQFGFLPIAIDILVISTFLFALFPLYSVVWLMLLLNFSLSAATLFGRAVGGRVV